MTIKFKLKFLAPKKGDPPFQPMANIYLGDHNVVDNNRRHLITPDCTNARQIAKWVDLLKKDLDEISKEARKKFAASKR